jgi:hypothetical protein
VKTWAVALILALLISSLAGSMFVDFASANPDGAVPALAMPVEYVNYTITRVNGTLWAKIDGNYPIRILNQAGCSFNGELPMVYPMPPGTTDIHVTLGDMELSWINYTEAYPEALHHTAIGDWWMIYSVLTHVSDFFVLKIHYEHPLALVNGSYMFLYDLNISPYLSPQSDNSTAYFTIRMEANTTNLQAFTTGVGNGDKWSTINYTTAKKGTTDIVAIQMHSEYNEPLLGDLVVAFFEADQVPEFPVWMMLILGIAVLLVALIYLKRRQTMFSASLSKTTTLSNT